MNTKRALAVLAWTAWTAVRLAPADSASGILRLIYRFRR